MALSCISLCVNNLVLLTLASFEVSFVWADNTLIVVIMRYQFIYTRFFVFYLVYECCWIVCLYVTSYPFCCTMGFVLYSNFLNFVFAGCVFIFFSLVLSIQILLLQ